MLTGRSVLNMPDRVDWKACSVSKEDPSLPICSEKTLSHLILLQTCSYFYTNDSLDRF